MRHLDDPGARVTEVLMRNSPEGEHTGRYRAQSTSTVGTGGKNKTG